MKDCLESLNRVPPNNIIERYLLRRRLVDISLEHAKAATFCFRYLTSKPFLLGTDHDAIERYARQGYYGFQDYAVQYTLDHFEQYTELDSAHNVYVSQQTMEAAGTFLAEYSLPNSSPRDKFTHKDIINFVKKLPTDRREKADNFITGCRTLIIRRHIEQIRLQDLSPSDIEIIENVYGLQAIYKCPKVWCDYFSNGFDKEQHRMAHVQCHERPFSCPTEGCFALEFGFDTQSKLNEHVKQHHKSNEEGLRFPRTGKNGNKMDGVEDQSKFSDAARRGDLATLSAFLEPGPITEEFFRSITVWVTGNWLLKLDPLYQAAKEGHVGVCKLLLERGVCLDWYYGAPGPSFQRKDAGGIAPMRIAVEKGFSDVVHLFLTSPTLPVAENSFMLEVDAWIRKACGLGHSEVVKLLIECPKTRDILTRSGMTESPSWWRRILAECGNNHPDSVKYLLENGFSKGITPGIFFSAEEHGWETLASLLKPIVNLPDFSQRRAEAFLCRNDIDSTLWELGPFTAFQDQSPQDQQKIMVQWREQDPRNLQYQLQLMELERKNKERIMMHKALDDKEKAERVAGAPVSGT